MKRYIRGSVLPTVIVVSVLILMAMLGLLTLWEQESLAFARNCRLRQARADIESAYMFYRLHPVFPGIVSDGGFLLRDSVPLSRVFIEKHTWGLYEAVCATTVDSLLHCCRLFGVEPDTISTFFYADNRSAVTLAGQTLLQGYLSVPRNGVVYGRHEADFYSGPEISRAMLRQSTSTLPSHDTAALRRIARMFALKPSVAHRSLPDSLCRSFREPTSVFCVADARIGGCKLFGNVVLYADELHIDASCRIGQALICARKVTVGEGARISAQIFAGDTVIVAPNAVLEYPSGIYSQSYAETGAGAEVNGYVIVRDKVLRKKPSANYRQSRTARVRGLVWIDGIAQIQGVVSGRMCLRQAVYFSPVGYYKDLLYDVTLLANPHTAQPLWLAAAGRRKEAVCIN